MGSPSSGNARSIGVISWTFGGTIGRFIEREASQPPPLPLCPLTHTSAFIVNSADPTGMPMRKFSEAAELSRRR